MSESSCTMSESSCYGINSLAFCGSLLWNSFPSNVKQSHNLVEFKLEISNLGKFTVHVLCVIETNLTISFYCLCYVSLIYFKYIVVGIY